MDPYARSVAADDGDILNSIIASTDTAYNGGSYSAPSWNEAVIYERHIPTFNADPAPAPPGTFESAMIRLPELAQLGINAIEIMPRSYSFFARAFRCWPARGLPVSVR